ncbi:MAG: hypothetical protein RLN75_02650, partial [Longimicrobiales bacterium]
MDSADAPALGSADLAGHEPPTTRSRIRRRILVSILAASGGACGGSDEDPDASPFRQSAFRVRAGVEAPLDADTAWIAGVGEAVPVRADDPFRLRIELEADEDAPAPVSFGLQVRRNGGAWSRVVARDFPSSDGISSPPVSIVSTPAYDDRAPTTDLLPGSDRPFVPGAGVALDSATGPWSGAGAHGEWEWPLVIRRFADQAVTNDDGDLFEFRMIDRGGRPVGGAPAAVLLRLPPGLLGGAFVETPGRLGPWSSVTGALYFPIEPAETFNVLMMVGSTDGGATWSELDASNRPATVDLDGFATALRDGRIHMLHQTDSVFYHAFATAEDRDGPDRWVVRDEIVAVPSEPRSQTATLEVRTDGSVVAVYGDSTGLRIRIRNPGGAWAEERAVLAADGALLTGVQSVLAGGDVVHLAYAAHDGAEREIRHRTIGPDGTLSPARTLATGVGTRIEEDAGALAPLLHLAETDTVVAVYRLADGRLWARRWAGDGSGDATPPALVSDRRVVQNAVDSDQVGADAVADGTTVHVLFID